MTIHGSEPQTSHISQIRKLIPESKALKVVVHYNELAQSVECPCLSLNVRFQTPAEPLTAKGAHNTF